MSAVVDNQPTNGSDLNTYLVDVERDLLKYIIENLKQRRLPLKTARELAREFLGQLPAADKADLLRKLDTLGAKYSEVKYVFAKYNAPEVETQRQQKLEEMRQHLQSGNIEQALAVAKGGNA